MKTFDQHSRFGIWGFGVMGKSAVSYLHASGYPVSILDKRMPTLQEQQFLQEKNIAWYTQDMESDLFFNSCDFIILSPGININQLHYATYKHKFISELDFFVSIFINRSLPLPAALAKHQ